MNTTTVLTLTAFVATAAVSSLRAETVAEVLAGAGSHILVQVDVPFDVVTAWIVAELQPSYEGSVPDFTDALTDDAINWLAIPGPVIVMSENGTLVAVGTASGSVNARGELLFADVSETLNLSVTIRVQVAPELTSDWQIFPNATAQATIDEARVSLLGVFELSLRSELQDDLDRSVQSALARAEAELSASSFLRAEAEKMWSGVCRTDGGTFVRPTGISASQPQITEDGIRVSVILDFRVETEHSVCGELPATLRLLEQ